MYNVVPESVLAELQAVARDARDKGGLAVGRRVVDAPLQHAAAVAVLRDVEARGARSVVDKERVLRRQLLEAALDDMVAVEIGDEDAHVTVQHRRQHRHLFVALNLNTRTNSHTQLLCIGGVGGQLCA